MHELLLYGQVPQARHEQVLKVLAGVAAMQPRRILKRHIVYKPLREPEEPGSNLRRGGSQAVAVKNNARPATSKPLYFTQLVQQLPADYQRGESRRVDGNPMEATSTTTTTSTTSTTPTSEAAVSEPQWTHEWHDQPDPVDKGVLIRQSYSSGGIEGNPHAYITALGNK